MRTVGVMLHTNDATYLRVKDIKPGSHDSQQKPSYRDVPRSFVSAETRNLTGKHQTTLRVFHPMIWCLSAPASSGKFLPLVVDLPFFRDSTAELPP